MSHSVLTVMAAASAAALAEDAVELASAALGRLGAEVQGRNWLAPRAACDIAVADLDPDQADAAARLAIAERWPGAAIDLVAQAAEGRRKRLLLADMESTIIANEMLDELADLKGLREHVAAITRRA